ncbi:Fcf2 pre-rRNA processing-domain-containing protein [Coprinopsis sp. MPI-PUGE-AT-0042]|nr:Fcf2 pre-rRNA processing-domain-containing protein [Coprinopsis sp. MPI-PUGE-AT-0042]KAH6912522.1 Fcf2 pre-rRNA processing-domain-containing protein [Coprinopsis sp. MPI-PUGE-AT-0042]
MASTLDKGKGKAKAIEPVEEEEPQRSSQLNAESDSESSSSGSSSSESESDSDSDISDSDEDEPEITQEYLDSLIEKAKQNASAKEQGLTGNEEEEDVLTLDSEKPLPSLDPGNLPKPYIEVGTSKRDPTTMRDPEVESMERKSASLLIPQPPVPPPELSKSGKPLTKKERKEQKKVTAGPDWFDLPAPAEAELPRLYREVEALRLKNHLDPKRFYRKDEGEGKGIKGLPKYFAIGKVVTSDSPFSASTSENLTRAERKRTLVDELVDDAEAKRYAKKKFNDFQGGREAKGRNTLRTRQAKRLPKW